MILTGYAVQSDDEVLSNPKASPISVAFEPFAVVKDIIIGKAGIDGLCAVYEGNCSVIRASVWKDAKSNDDESDDAQEEGKSNDDPEHEEVPLRDYQVAMIVRANANLEAKLKEVVSTGVYYQFGDSKTAWRSVESAGKFKAQTDTVDSIFPAKAIQDQAGRLLLTCTVYPQYTSVTFSDNLTADTLNLSISTNKLMGAMNL